MSKPDLLPDAASPWGHYETALSSLGDAVIVTDAAGRIASMNAVAEALTGWPRDEARGRPLGDVVVVLDEGSRRRIDDPVRGALRAGEATGTAKDALLVGRDGRERPVGGSAAPVRDDEGGPCGAVLVLRDVTERREQERAVLRSEERLRFVTERGEVGYWHWDIPGDRLEWSPLCKRLFGIPEDEVMSYARFLEAVHPEDRTRTDRAVRACLEGHGRTDYDVEYRTRWPDGTVRWIHAKGSATFDGDAPLRMAGIALDITDRKTAEEGVRTSEARLRRLIDSLFAFVGVLTPEGVLVEANKAPLEAAGLALEDVRGRPFDETFWWSHSPEVQARLRDAMAAARGGGVRRYDETIRVGEDRFITIDFMISALRDESGRVTHLVPTGVDVTARVETERALREEGRRKELFLATVGHEIRNPLAALDGAMRLIGSGEVELAALHRMMASHLHQLMRLVDDLLEVSRITEGKVALRKAPADLVGVVRAAVGSVCSDIERKRQSLVLSLPERLQAEVDAVRVEQVAANLLSNAARFTPDQGRIEVDLRREGRQAVLAVRDTGRGFAPEDRERLFEPFAQENPGSGGLGLGLPLARRLVELHGGTVRAESPGRGLGATFTVRLPVGDLRTRRPEPPRPAAERLARPLRVLIVDDLRDAADAMALLLRRVGAETRCAYTAAEGLAAAREWRPEVALVDIGLPDEPGTAIAEAIRADDGGDVLLLAVTGFGDDGAEARIRQAGFDGRLVKPIDHEELYRLLHRRAGAGEPAASRDGPPGSLSKS